MFEPITIKFVIFGNQENQNGNPIPYHRTTQGSYWNKGSMRYNAWKFYVQKSLEKSGQWFKGILNTTGKPILLNRRTAEMNIKIFWADNTHADADNIFKGIADALFVNDKNLTKGSFDSCMAADKNAKVECEIIIKEKSN